MHNNTILYRCALASIIFSSSSGVFVHALEERTMIYAARVLVCGERKSVVCLMTQTRVDACIRVAKREIARRDGGSV